jgi:AcrR family transcriptional regulator
MPSIRTPKQPRGIDTKNRIMTAAFALYAKKGIHGTNSREIAEKAGVSIGSFYSYFKNKKTLLLEMLEDYLNRHFLAIWKAMDAVSINEMQRKDIHILVQSVFSAYGISPEFHRQTHALRYSDPDINKVYERERQREVTQIRYLLESNRHRMRISDPEAAAVVIHNAVESVAHTAKFIGPKTNEEALMDALSDMIYNYLLFGRQQP